ncbi:peptidoglycan DD-metalloendopeptidase family protein [Tabrizicola sp.]|uniref:peptidoglycan DD-metalloendopeptidase family protein n=1 Tax=Tabrizicola sp. TaxID=2005166 RepID=UPI0026244A4A|nr:peptidoglycan DD-metalloendopeptidase family protein [Tabrizicola sp.]MDM7930324.1 peptidoglycan DD-metalloendopeptidase family protein [Tabrizicola sp.]
MQKINGRIRTGLVLGASALALSACVNTGELDWDLRGGGGSTSEAARQSTAAAPRPDANGILSYPDYQLAKARRGDTVAAMAGRLGLNPEELARTNALRPTDPLRDGELLLLPKRVSAAPQPATIGGGSGPVDITAIATTALDSAGPSSAPAPTASKPVAAQPSTHRVARGETAFTIARTYNVSAKALADWNQLGSDMAIREGQTLIIPIATAPAPNREPVPTSPGAGSPTPEPPSASKPLPNEKTEAAASKPKATPPSPDLGSGTTGASASAFVMPVQGKIIRGYDKRSNQGIDIAAAAGTPVKAAASGTVAAITRDTGQVPIVVIRHTDGLLTVYAGLDGLTVKKGDTVKRGQTIGAVRKADPAFLHFEVRKGVDSLDPMTYLR